MTFIHRYKIMVVVFSLFLLSSCTKDVPKELLQDQNSKKQNQQQSNQQQSNQQMPDDSIHRNLGRNQNNNEDKSDVKGDAKAEQMIKEADDAEVKYERSKSESDKKTCITKQLSAANYLMFEANLSPKKKYRTALQRYRRVLELDPGNKEAAENKKQIEDIYQSMGMPVPN